MEKRLSKYKVICLLYEQLYRQASMRTTFTYTPKPNDIKIIVKFIGWCKKNYREDDLTIEFFVRYFEFQFARYAGTLTPRGRNSVMINWLVGEKAITAWSNRMQSTKNLIFRYKITKQFALDLKKQFRGEKKVTVIGLSLIKGVAPHEEAERLRYLNRTDGWYHCRDFTTLFSPISEVCSQCIFREKCIKRTEHNYPELFNRRKNLISDGRTIT